MRCAQASGMRVEVLRVTFGWRLWEPVSNSPEVSFLLPQRLVPWLFWSLVLEDLMWGTARSPAVMATCRRLLWTPEICVIQPTLDSLSKESPLRVQQDRNRISAISLEGHLYRSLIESCWRWGHIFKFRLLSTAPLGIEGWLNLPPRTLEHSSVSSTLVHAGTYFIFSPSSWSPNIFTLKSACVPVKCFCECVFLTYTIGIVL